MFLLAGILAIGGSTSGAGAQVEAGFTFTGSGWGHGVGMSQYGARAMADDGFDRYAILGHYYRNTEIIPFAPIDDLRIHLDDAPSVDLSSAGSVSFEQGGVPLLVSEPGTSVRVSASDGGLALGGTWVAAPIESPVVVSFPKPVRVSTTGHSYLWGKLQLTNRNGQVRVVESNLPMEKYIAGISEMPASWPTEALAAQAIAARSYGHEIALHRRNSAEWAQEYDISATTLDQNYVGWDAQDDPWDAPWVAAVESSATVELIYGGTPIRAYYSAATGGHTENAAYVFNNDVAYAIGVEDPYDLIDNPWSDWTRSYTVTDLSRWLGRADDTSVGTVASLSVSGLYGVSDRIDKADVTITGSDGEKVVNGRRLMLVINAGILSEGGGISQHLPSTRTTVRSSVDAVDAAVDSNTSTDGAEQAADDVPAQPVSADPADAATPEVSAAEPVSGPPAVAPREPRPDQETTAPVGALDLVGADPGAVVVAGWALDPDVPAAAVDIEVFVDGFRWAAFPADLNRSDVGESYPDAGPMHGFHHRLAVGEGSHLVCVTYLDEDGQTHLEAGCGEVVVPPAESTDAQVAVSSASNPELLGSFDLITASDTGITVAGWTLAEGTVEPVDVIIYINSTEVIRTPANRYRGDIATAHPAAGPDHAFHIGIGLASGDYRVCAEMAAIGSEDRLPLGCGDIAV